VVMFHWWGSDPWLPWVNSPKPDRPAFVCVLHHEGIAAKAGYDRYVLVSRSQLPQVSQVPAERVVVIPNGSRTRISPLLAMVNCYRPCAKQLSILI
jgi:hypothetical protein